MAYSKESILKESKEIFESAVALRRHLHMHPELSRKEYRTSALIEERLKALGLEPRRIAETGVVADMKGLKGEGRTLVLRADIDALPMTEEHECPYKSQNIGAMHSCGHDAHTASLLSAAKILSRHREDFPGVIRLCFQQAEEIGYGGMQFVKAGCLDGVDRCFGMHLASEIECGKLTATPGPNNSSVDWMHIVIDGQCAHISHPEKGHDALFAASEAVTGIQKLLSRIFNPLDSVLLGIGKMTSGTSYNIISGRSDIEGTLRCYSPEARAKAKESIEGYVKSIAADYGCTASFEWKDYTSPLINDRKSSEEVASVITDLYGSDALTEHVASFGGDDFAEFILKAPGCYAFVGSGNDSMPCTRVAHHDVNFDIDERCLYYMVGLFSMYSLEYLNGKLD